MPQMGVAISKRVVQTVAKTTNTDALELPPLYDAIDPDALDTLVGAMSDGTVSFIYAGHEVTVASDGTISLGTHPTGIHSAELPASDD
jgi:hypothetical protein